MPKNVTQSLKNIVSYPNPENNVHFLLPSLQSHLNSESPVLVDIQFKTARLKIALMTHAERFPRNRLWTY